MSAQAPRIGVLALQGDFQEHAAILESLGVGVVEVRLPHQLEGVRGLIIPGGESTTIVKLIDAYGFRPALAEAVAGGMALWGTCAGMIVIARKLMDPYPQPLRLMDITVSRNWFGRQVDSFEVDLEIKCLDGGPFRGVFIRAPAFASLGRDVELLSALEDGTPVAVRSGRIMATAFHPELTDDTRVHEMFVKLA